LNGISFKKKSNPTQPFSTREFLPIKQQNIKTIKNKSAGKRVFLSIAPQVIIRVQCYFFVLYNIHNKFYE